MACQSGVRDVAHGVGSYPNTPQVMVFAFVDMMDDLPT
jgi:hypothetical protein